MYDIPEDCLLAYDPDDLDLHSNSTDFEDSHNLKVASKNGNHSLFSRKKLSKNSRDKTSENLLIYNSKTSKSRSKELYEKDAIYNDFDKNLEVHRCYQNKKSKIPLTGRQIETKRSKRQKIIPCLSGIFKWSNNHIAIKSVIKVENSCQTSRASCETKASKIYKKHQYLGNEPVYAVGRNICAQTNPFKPVKLNQHSSRTEYFNTVYAFSSSSEADNKMQQQKLIQAKKKWKNDNKNRKKCAVRESVKHSQTEHHSMINTLKHRRKFPFQVYSNSREYGTGIMPNSDITSCASTVPSTCSGFWDYLFNKINNKYQKVQVYKSCKCCTTEKSKVSPCCNIACNFGDDPSEIPTCCRTCLPPMTRTCSCNTQSASANTRDQPIPPEPPQTQTPIGPAPSAKFHMAPKSQRSGKSTDDSNQNPSVPFTPETPSQPPEYTCNDKPRCQLNHNDLATALNQKYNGEILCIHNPPCIVINGCLNLPPIEQNQTDSNGQNQSESIPMWRVKECLKPSYQKLYKSKRSKKRYQNDDEDDFEKGSIKDCQYKNNDFVQQAERPIKLMDQSCQYLIQTVDQCQVTEQKTEEKNVQCYCNHVPPCELQRKCRKLKYDPFFYSNCVHVPMCGSIPLCLLDSNGTVQNKTVCRHKPACIEVPKCSIDYIVLNAKGELCSQILPNTNIECHHVPPCIMIPKCLARMCAAGNLSQDAIPTCVHQPPCEMIPACCRKSVKGMVSVCSQYPNSCRIT